MKAWMLLALAPVLAAPAIAQLPSRGPYPAQVQGFAAPAVPLIEHANLRELEPALREALSGAPDFAGDQVLVQWGCGSDCLRLLAASGGLLLGRRGRDVRLSRRQPPAGAQRQARHRA